MTHSMEALIQTFPAQLRQALDIAQNATLKPAVPIRQILVAGMGGSGIGADLVAALARPSVPMATVKEYTLPTWAGPETLLLASSYSGNTEETLSVLEQATAQKCRIVGISSGGTVAQLTAEQGFDHISVPGGRPPRSTLGFSVVQQMHVLSHYGMCPPYREALLAIADQLEEQQTALRTQAKTLAARLVNHTPVLYAASPWQAVLLRWVQQIQENGKMLCWMNVLPELNHNELVGWKDQRDDLAVLFFSSALDHPRTARRSQITRGVVESYCRQVLEIAGQSTDAWLQTFLWIHLGDWLSVELAALRRVDPVEIAVIDRLKEELAKWEERS
ncbi:MAG: bifunctional phosphoglucose/phosphomannose isomerase [Bacteroidetes bacterium]|nr:bifunctional phosphoglucose/phosphomannose isomerase [Bacteroidota bacterium]